MSSNIIGDFFTWSLGPSVLAIVFTTLVSLLATLALHLWFYRPKASQGLPSFLLTGPSGSGKTSLLTLLETGKPAPTRTSQTSLTAEIELPVSSTAASNRYRSVNDPTNQIVKKFLLVDTPGHGKLRHFATEKLVSSARLKGIVFVVDASTLSVEGGGLTETAQYLHDILLALQIRFVKAKSSKGPSEIPVLVAANKMDLFTALPTKLVKTALEGEITKLRETQSKGLLDSGVGMDDQIDDKEILGGGGEGKFEFSLLEEYNVNVSIEGGNVAGADGTDVDNWWRWLADRL